LNNFFWSPFLKWPPQYRKIQHCLISSKFDKCRESIQDIIIYPHIKFSWYRTMLNFSRIVVAILKMATSRNCSMSWINSGHHYLETFLSVTIFKMATTILQKFNIVRYHQNLICG
jgi:hypothetical protein